MKIPLEFRVLLLARPTRRELIAICDVIWGVNSRWEICTRATFCPHAQNSRWWLMQYCKNRNCLHQSLHHSFWSYFYITQHKIVQRCCVLSSHKNYLQEKSVRYQRENGRRFWQCNGLFCTVVLMPIEDYDWSKFVAFLRLSCVFRFLIQAWKKRRKSQKRSST